MRSVLDRLVSKLDFDGTVSEHRPDLGPCWIWTASLRDGYGQISIGTRPQQMRSSHVVLYEITVGEVPAGCELDHLCRNRACCNPDHLDPVTHLENILRSPEALAAINARKTACSQGHELSERVLGERQKRRCGVCVENARLAKAEGDGRQRSAA
jgi:hypothetical protein